MLLRSVLCPRTHTEKIHHAKIFNRDPRLPQRADKILVKHFVRDRLGSEWVTPTLWHGEHLPPLEQRTWPIPFVVKANNGSSWNFFVRQQSDLDWKRIESLTAEWQSRRYGAEWGEWLYGAIIPALLVEPFIGELCELPVDYKLWTFGAGKSKWSRPPPIATVSSNVQCSIPVGIGFLLRLRRIPRIRAPFRSLCRLIG